MSVYKKEGRDTYSYDIRIRGQRFSGNTECTKKREAENFERKIRGELISSKKINSEDMDFGMASTLYWEQKGKFVENDVDFERALAWMQLKIGKKTRVRDISESVIAALVAARRDEGVSNATVNRSVTEVIRPILRRCERVWKQEVQSIEWKEHILPEAEERVREATYEEEKKLSDAMRDDYEPALRFAFLTGCRRAEIVGLGWRNIDFFNEEFTVKGKGKRSRTIPMTSVVRALLWSQKDYHATAVFTYEVKRTSDGRVRGQRRPITIEGFKTAWRRSRSRTDVEDFRFHDTRHTAATRLVRKTRNLKQAQLLLGHTEIGTTARYAHVTKNDLRAGLEASNTTDVTTNELQGANKQLKSR